MATATPDLIVSAHSDDTFANNAGAAHMFLGGTGATFDATPDLSFFGNSGADQLGTELSGLGDVNGDGFSDVGIAAVYDNVGFTNNGAVYVFYGGITPDDIADGILAGPADDARFGHGVGGFGDINGDGFDDLIIGADQFDSGGGSNSGTAYVFLGNAGPALDTTPDATLSGFGVDDNFGWDTAISGDVDGDGYDDVVVSARNADTNGVDAGAVYLFLGSSGAFDTTVDITFIGEGSDNFLGGTVASIWLYGDVGPMCIGPG